MTIATELRALIGDRDLNINDAAAVLEEIRLNLIFQDDPGGETASTVFAQHFYVSTLAKIEDAIQTLKLAALFAARERAGNF